MGLMSLLLMGGGCRISFGGRVRHTGSAAALIRMPVMPASAGCTGLEPFRFFTGTVGTPDAMRARDCAMAMRCRAGRLRPARLEREGSGAAQAAERWAGTAGEVIGCVEGKEVVVVAVVMSVAVGTDGMAKSFVDVEVEGEGGGPCVEGVAVDCCCDC